ncbi:fumarylacetoacetate hydrolase family protein [Nanchangia anserum]|uniref:fumarylacetoacetate hydrolase family protein n=1 Tax=Nanchangia anserum TaxID=2692125 RepID=UPI001884267C|nr:fumarylacetoacetate hydrolase family protein [Nanchangia anserum]QOX81654.1 fumarylacetoacetate hydrolase family protein [Nanchangia anserum]
MPTPAATEPGESIDYDSVELLAPCRPSKVIAVAKNYAKHAEEMHGEVPPTPVLFFKTPNTVVGPGHPIVRPRWAEIVHYEGELAVVIGTRAKDIPAERAWDVIAGFTCANDVSVRDAQRSDGQWARAKGFDTACPLGPWIVPVEEWQRGPKQVTTRVNGEIVQDGSTGDMVRGIEELIAYASAAFTLMPGDVILTGTPAGVGPIVSGDTVTVHVEDIGELENPVVDDGECSC